MEGNTSTSQPEAVCKIGMKIPPFWAQEPALWFAQIEGNFFISGITADSTKFYHVIAQLDHQYAAEVKDIITAPPKENKYEKLKNELIKRLSESQEKKVKQLLVHEELGDRKPSQFLRHLQTLAGQNIPDTFLRTLWSSRLPQNIQTVIATQPNTTLEAVAELADKVYEIAPPTPVLASIGPGTSSHVVSELSKQIEELTRQVSSLQGQVRSNNRGRFPRRRSATPNRNRSRSDSNHRNNGHCWYHSHFGAKARKCTTPCSYATSSSLNANGSRN
ncbi:hypothetical protein ABMA27_000911 [Loxostege sticticalis]|uniref:DUF7041 domain-containing protein n=1 Tax=Loxostege sticticalis TaxID=481309 RepID=A0ABR3HMW5_LOXSC